MQATAMQQASKVRLRAHRYSLICAECRWQSGWSYLLIRVAAIGEASDLELGERNMGDLEGPDQEGLLN